MDQHWRSKVSVAEHHGNVTQVGPDLIAAFFVTLLIGFNLNNTAVTRQDKMMSGFQVVKAHYFIASFVHLLH